jgi:ATP-dependent exoDNAse (exonuclease V) beta subunit
LKKEEMFKALESHHIFYNSQKFDQSPFYESVEEIIRSFKLLKESDAYVQFFLDFVLEFTQRKSKNNIGFLDVWEQKKDKLSIVASNNKNAVQIMTIHKSKGLEFPVVIYPYDLDMYRQINPQAWYDKLEKEKYNNFENILVSSSAQIEQTGDYGKKIFKKQTEELELDNFNLLYVALTRAKEQLFIISEHRKIKDKRKYYSHFFIDFLQKSGIWSEGKLEYEFGDKKRQSVKVGNNTNVEIQKEFISTSWQDHQINIVPSSELIWDEEREEAIAFGNLVHEMMAGIISRKDIDKTILKFINKGFLLKKEAQGMRDMIDKIVNHSDLSTYFQPDRIVMNEREILTDENQILIPDRLIFNGNLVTVIDYKTGRPEKEHEQQINNYALVLQEMDFEIHEKILVYIDKNIKVKKLD